MGRAGEELCNTCDASEPGGDTPGLVIGVPLGAVAGVWFIGHREPPSGRLEDTVLGALIGAAVFGAYGELLKNGDDLLRWSGALFPAAVASMGWNRSRLTPVPAVSWRSGPRGPEVRAEWTVMQVRF